MKSQRLLWILSVVFILATFIHIAVVHRKIKRLNEINQLQAVELSTLNDSLLIYENKAGELTYKLSVVEVSHSNLKESLDKAGFEIKQLKERDINWRKVNNALKLQLEATGQGETALTDSFYVIKTDTIRYNSFAWSNNYLTLNGSVQDERLFFDYKYKTGIQILQTRDRSATIVSVALTDPNAAIVSGNSITVKHEKKWYQRPVVWAVVGFAGGVIIVK
jgi:hypothetical protein